MADDTSHDHNFNLIVEHPREAREFFEPHGLIPVPEPGPRRPQPAPHRTATAVPLSLCVSLVPLGGWLHSWTVLSAGGVNQNGVNRTHQRYTHRAPSDWPCQTEVVQ